ncbi:AMP-binding protein [Pacificimonas sp. WHA3]|uniref:AMP-binding protein n=1 Tax=Pacificimonas pallii TaxID=2827236 RepID=A0ABS6SBN2_9SPHN|nr:AMP-binding protein [Pacificimonas pallii]MBV7255316.1 AMP-binding protein [Pacificimonas pallii]
MTGIAEDGTRELRNAQALPPSLSRISDYVSWFARETPEAEALVLGDRRIDYATFHRQVDELARALLASGVTKGDRVATLCTPSPDYFICFLATASIGGIWVGMNPRYQIDELEYVASDSEPVVLLARTAIDGRNYGGEIAQLVSGHASIRAIVLLDTERDEQLPSALSYSQFIATGALIAQDTLIAARERCGGRDPCMIVYTSGSTGKPKGALLHHAGIAEFSLGQNRIWPISPLRALNYFPVNHIGCVVDISCPTLVAGGTLVFMEHFEPRRSMELMVEERITLWGSVPSVFQLQLALEDIDTFDLSAVQLILWEGAAMPREIIDRLLEYGRPLASNYGMTESCGAMTVTPPTRDISVLERTVGWPFKGVEMRIAGGDGQPVAMGDTGELQALSPFTMVGYWNRPDATAEVVLDDGWLATGDLGKENPDGTYSIVGRAKEMYKSGGYNVYPREVENALEAHPAVDLAAVVSVTDPLWQEVGVAFVLLTCPASEADLKRHCRSKLANYKNPKKIVIVDSMPLLPIGKVDKVSLRQRAEELYAPENGE